MLVDNNVIQRSFKTLLNTLTNKKTLIVLRLEDFYVYSYYAK